MGDTGISGEYGGSHPAVSAVAWLAGVSTQPGERLFFVAFTQKHFQLSIFQIPCFL
jgi:hypothetical protein